MRKIISQMMVTLDGFIEGPNQEIDWHSVDQEFNNYAIDLLNNVDTLLFGRTTYELMARYWTTEQAIAASPVVAQKMNSLSKLVFSTTLNKAEWRNTKLVKENIVEEIAHTKQRAGKNIAIFGSSDLSLTFIQHNLIDEYRVIVCPTVLGQGKSLFQGLPHTLNLKLIKSRVFAGGAILLQYEPR